MDGEMHDGVPVSRMHCISPQREQTSGKEQWAESASCDSDRGNIFMGWMFFGNCQSDGEDEDGECKASASLTKLFGKLFSFPRANKYLRP